MIVVVILHASSAERMNTEKKTLVIGNCTLWVIQKRTRDGQKAAPNFSAFLPLSGLGCSSDAREGLPRAGAKVKFQDCFTTSFDNPHVAVQENGTDRGQRQSRRLAPGGFAV
jgi:hypothetical protein